MALVLRMDGAGSCACKCRLLDPFCLHAYSPQFIHSRVDERFRRFRSRRGRNTPRQVRQVLSPPSCFSLKSKCSVNAARGMLTTTFLSGTMGLLITILFLFCTPNLDTLFSFNAPQPFVQLYALALGKGPSIFMTLIAVIGLVLVHPFP